MDAATAAAVTFRVMTAADAVGVLVGFVDEDVMILVHMVAPRIELVQRVFSDSALGDDTSTSGIRWRALSKLRFRWCWVMLIRVLVTWDTGGNRIPIDMLFPFSSPSLPVQIFRIVPGSFIRWGILAQI